MWCNSSGNYSIIKYIHSFIYPLTQQIFSEHLIYTNHSTSTHTYMAMREVYTESWMKGGKKNHQGGPP